MQTYKIYKYEFLYLYVNEITKSNTIFIKKETFPEYKKGFKRQRGVFVFHLLCHLKQTFSLSGSRKDPLRNLALYNQVRSDDSSIKTRISRLGIQQEGKNGISVTRKSFLVLFGRKDKSR